VIQNVTRTSRRATNNCQNRGFKGLLGVSFGKTPSLKPLQGIGCGSLSGFSGFDFNYREIFKNDNRGQMSNQGLPAKVFPATEKNHRNPKNPVFAEHRCYPC
jgi:hypothetical protein